MKKIGFIVLVLCWATTLYSQITDDEYIEVRRSLNHMFQYFYKSSVPTGYLLDYGIDLVEFGDYDGTQLTDYNKVNSSVYKDVYKSIQSCNVLFSVMPDMTKIDRFFEVDAGLYISIIAYKYNYIKENALEDNLIAYDQSTGRVMNVMVDNIMQNPYSEAVITASCPNYETTTLSTTYRLSSGMIFSNLKISAIYLDADDGKGYQGFSTSSPINVTYSDYGIKTLKIKIRTIDGGVYESHSSINVVNRDDNNGNLQGGSIPTMPDYKHTFCAKYDSKEVYALMSCYYIPGHTSITKPFIVAEGFDPWIL